MVKHPKSANRSGSSSSSSASSRKPVGGAKKGHKNSNSQGNLDRQNARRHINPKKAMMDTEQLLSALEKESSGKQPKRPSGQTNKEPVKEPEKSGQKGEQSKGEPKANNQGTAQGGKSKKKKKKQKQLPNNPATILKYVLSKGTPLEPNLSRLLEEEHSAQDEQSLSQFTLKRNKYKSTVPLVGNQNFTITPSQLDGCSINSNPLRLSSLPCIHYVPDKTRRWRRGKQEKRTDKLRRLHNAPKRSTKAPKGPAKSVINDEDKLLEEHRTPEDSFVQIK